MSSEFKFFKTLRNSKKTTSGFEVRIIRKGSAGSTLDVEVRGPLKNEGTSVSYSFFLEDLTGGEKNGFMLLRGGESSLVDNFTLTSSFCEVSAHHDSRDWECVLSLPLNKIQFARKGTRQLKGNLIVNGGAVSACVTYDYLQEESGFENVADAKYGLYSAVFSLICGFRAEYPSGSQSAVSAAADWLLGESADWSAIEKKEVFARFANLAESIPPIIGWRDACTKYSEPLRVQANTEFRNGVVRLFYSILIGTREIVKVDKELHIFYDLCIALGATMDVFSRLTDKLVLACDLEEYEPDVLLGVHSDMTVDELKVHLRDGYKTWNERVTHSDEVIRNKALYMMKLISERRGQLNGVS